MRAAVEHSKESLQIDERFLRGKDYRVEVHVAPAPRVCRVARAHSGPTHGAQMPAPMARHYQHIFELNDVRGRGHLRVAELSEFMASLGHGAHTRALIWPRCA